MTDETKEQAALDTQSVATPTEQVPEAQDDLDALLAEHDQQTADVQQPVSQPQDAAKIDQLYQFMQQERQEREQRQTAEVVSQAVKSIKEIAGAENMEDDFVDTILQGQATKDARIRLAFQNREKNPAAWNAALKTVAAAVKKYAPKDDEDRAAVTAAVRSGSSSKSEPERDFPGEKEIHSMSDREFADMWKNVK
jgi:hypothetical protein